MNSIEIYQRILIDLDKYQTPELEIDYFNHYMVQAMNEYVDKKYQVFETTQKTTDDLREFSKRVSISKVVGEESFLLPDDYRHLLGLTGTANTDCGIIKATFEKTTADTLAYNNRNYYRKPSRIRPYYQIIGNDVFLYQGNNINYFSQFLLEYISIPVYYYINPSDISDFSSPNYSDAIESQIIDLFVRAFRGATEQQTYQVSIQESQIKNNIQ